MAGIARNSLTAAFLPDAEKRLLLDKLSTFMDTR